MRFLVYLGSVQRVTLLCVGTLKTRWIAEGCGEYFRRLKHSLHMEVVEIPASKAKDPGKQAAEESARLLEALAKREGDVWILDERGERKSSQEFARVLAQARDAGCSLIFILGGAYGLTEELRERAARVLRISDMTFPHELCRLLFLEQLYRANEIMRGSGYHH